MNRDTQALIYAILCIVIVWATMRWWPVRGTKPPKVELPPCCDEQGCEYPRPLTREQELREHHCHGPESWGDE